MANERGAYAVHFLRSAMFSKTQGGNAWPSLPVVSLDTWKLVHDIQRHKDTAGFPVQSAEHSYPAVMVEPIGKDPQLFGETGKN